MKSQACEQCAKRKVRCDKQEPCSNCKRRKTTRCSYAESSPDEKIKKLEALVRSLRDNSKTVDPESPNVVGPLPPQQDHRRLSVSCENHDFVSAPTSRSQDPVVMEEDGRQVYLESNAWQNWTGRDPSVTASRAKRTGTSLFTAKHPDVFPNLTMINKSSNLAQDYPSQENGSRLWDVFFQRIEPLVRTSFRWDLDRLRLASIDVNLREQFANSQHAFMFALYLISVISLSEDECRKLLGQQRSSLIEDYQTLCETALCQTNLFCISDILTLKACILHIMASIDRLSTRSLWSLMGLIVRSAESLGLHRDGTLLGLSPVATEERRRLWWQLQHLDLVMAVRSGSTPMTLTADWDVKMPLNIEDEDLNPAMTAPPKERPGLTSMSYCLFAYWTIGHQRQYLHGDKSRFELSWQSNTSLPSSFKEDLINQLEESLNRKFLQFCDPIKPLDTLIQISARFLVCGMRLRIIHHPFTSSKGPERVGEQERDALLSAALQSLEYNLALHSQRSIRHFNWLTKGFFPWHALMIVLVELAQRRHQSKVEEMWTLLSDLYSTNPHLSQVSHDRRCGRAAELVIAAWKAHQNKPSATRPTLEPDFVTSLKSRLEEQRVAASMNLESQQSRQPNVETASENVPPKELLTEQDFGSLFDLDFDNIDWSFWSSVD